MLQRHIRTIAIAALLWCSIGSARADAIDGDWCLASTHFTIEGPSITTPGGNKLQGHYTRHAFAYVVPDRENGAGSHIDMVLLNEETLRLTRTPPGATAAMPETWKRCKPIS